MSLAADIIALEELVDELTLKKNILANIVSDTIEPVVSEGQGVFQDQADNIWLLIAAFLVFFMHCGFTMLEAGSVRMKNSMNIMFKNVGTIAIGSLAYFVLGYGFAYGEDTKALAFIGNGNYLTIDLGAAPDADKASGFASGLPFFVFQLMFAATAATIVSGAVAGRVALVPYFGIAAFLTAFVYPVVSHWVWATGGWISAFTDQTETFLGSEDDIACGMIDFAGSGVVHMTGGIAAFWGALIIGPRLGRFLPDGSPDESFTTHNYALTTLGTFILWFGWYGFNCGSTLVFEGATTAKVAVTTTLAPSAAVVSGTAITYLLTRTWDIGTALNCVLAGLVSITAGCSVVSDSNSILIGLIGGLVYVAADKLMIKLGVDDPVNAVAVHGFCGLWGVLSIGIFSTSEEIFAAYGERDCEGAGGEQFGVQMVGALTIIAWVSAFMIPAFLGLKFAGVLRVSEEVERAGIDFSEHGASVYEKAE
jgi:Amt family ammonium transporter